MGSAAALELVRAGRHVLVLEQHELGHDQGGSHGGSRLFRLDYSSPDRLAQARRAERLWRGLEDESGECWLTNVGGIEHGMSPQRVQTTLAWCSDADVPLEVLSAAAAAERWPQLAFEDNVVHQPGAGRLDPDRALAGIRRLAVGAGAEFRPGARAEALIVRHSGDGRPGDDGVVEVRTADATVEARQVVAAVGSWAPTLLGQQASLPPITVTQEQPRHFRPRDDATDWPVFVHWRDEAGPYGRNAGYGCFEPGLGVKVGLHRSGPTIDPDEPRDLDPALAEAVVAYAARWFPGLDVNVSSPLSCLYDNTPDGQFVIDRVGPISYATGFSGEGFKFVPVVGEMLCDLVTGVPAGEGRG